MGGCVTGCPKGVCEAHSPDHCRGGPLYTAGGASEAYPPAAETGAVGSLRNEPGDAAGGGSTVGEGGVQEERKVDEEAETGPQEAGEAGVQEEEETGLQEAGETGLPQAGEAGVQEEVEADAVSVLSSSEEAESSEQGETSTDDDDEENLSFVVTDSDAADSNATWSPRSDREAAQSTEDEGGSEQEDTDSEEQERANVSDEPAATP